MSDTLIYILLIVLLICVALLVAYYSGHLFTGGGGGLEELPLEVLYPMLAKIHPDDFFNLIRVNKNLYEKLKPGRVIGYDIWAMKMKERDEIKRVEKHPSEIQYIQNPSPHVQMAAVLVSNLAVRFIENPTEEVQEYIMRGRSWDQRVDNIKNLHEKFHEKVVTFKPNSARNIKNLSVKLQRFMVDRDPRDFEFIQNPDLSVQIAAVSKIPDLIQYIQNPDPSVQIAAAKSDGNILRILIEKHISPSRDVQVAAITNNPHSIRFVSKPDEELQLLAVNNDGTAVEQIEDPSLKTVSAAVQRSPAAINAFYNKHDRFKPSREILLSVIERDPMALYEPIKQKKFVLDDELQMAIVKNSKTDEKGVLWDLILLNLVSKGLKPSEELQLAAVKTIGQNGLGNLYDWGIKPSAEVLKAYVGNALPIWRTRSFGRKLQEYKQTLQ